MLKISKKRYNTCERDWNPTTSMQTYSYMTRQTLKYQLCKAMRPAWLLGNMLLSSDSIKRSLLSHFIDIIPGISNTPSEYRANKNLFGQIKFKAKKKTFRGARDCEACKIGLRCKCYRQFRVRISSGTPSNATTMGSPVGWSTDLWNNKRAILHHDNSIPHGDRSRDNVILIWCSEICFSYSDSCFSRLGCSGLAFLNLFPVFWKWQARMAEEEI